jgi:hypothetical protein
VRAHPARTSLFLSSLGMSRHRKSNQKRYRIEDETNLEIEHSLRRSGMTLNESDIGDEGFEEPNEQRQRPSYGPTDLPEGDEEPFHDASDVTDSSESPAVDELPSSILSSVTDAPNDESASMPHAAVATHEKRPWASLIGRSLHNPDLRRAIASGEPFDHLLIQPNEGESVGVTKLPDQNQPEHKLVKYTSNGQDSQSGTSVMTTETASPAPPVLGPTTHEKLYTADELAQLHSSGDVDRLLIEVEVSLSNAERIAGIAVEQAKSEFKKLAAASTAKLEDQFQQFRADFRVMWGRR